MRVYLTVDVEEDIPPFLNTWRGMKGVWTILHILEEVKVSATFFTTAETAIKYPKVVEKIAERHELASHSYYHVNMRKYSAHQQERMIRLSHSVLSKYQKIKGFRAPYFQADLHCLRVLKKLNYVYDSSYPLYKRGSQSIIDEYAPTVSNLLFRVPHSLSTKIIMKYCKRDIAPVLFIHPWEVVKNRQIGRIDCTFLTGGYLAKNFRRILLNLKRKKVDVRSIICEL